MRNKMLRLNNPCNKNWEEMQPNDHGRHCDLCSKTVIDFTKLSNVEISELLKRSNDQLCARVSRSQLESPISYSENKFELNFPKSRVAAGLMLVSSLAVGQQLDTTPHVTLFEVIQGALDSETYLQGEVELVSHPVKLGKGTVFKGQITSSRSEKPLKGVQVTFVSPQKLFTAYTDRQGKFSMEIPKHAIDEQNVIRVSYEYVKDHTTQETMMFYETEDYILSREDLSSEYMISAQPEIMYLGGIGMYYENLKPIVLFKGTEIKFSDFIKASEGKKNAYKLENKEILYFESEFAVAIYGKKAKDGLYIVVDERKRV